MSVKKSYTKGEIVTARMYKAEFWNLKNSSYNCVKKNKMGISKSLYINGMKYTKLLWLSKHRKGDGSVFALDASLKAVFESGNEVGEIE